MKWLGFNIKKDILDWEKKLDKENINILYLNVDVGIYEEFVSE